MSKAQLTISSKNYGAWSMRGWLLCKLADLDFEEISVPSDDPSIRAELLLLSPSFLVPKLSHDGVTIWDTLAIAEYLNEWNPDAGLIPTDRHARALCRSICGEMHAGFANLRSALPLNVKATFPGFKVWTGVQADIERIAAVWGQCLATHGGPYLFGANPTMADAMFAPVCSRFVTYDVALDPTIKIYCTTVMAMPAIQEWVEGARNEPEELEELDVEF